MAPVEYLILSYIHHLLFIFHCIYEWKFPSRSDRSKMEASSNMQPTDRALQAGSGNLGDNRQKNHGVSKRSRSLIQQSLGQATDEENPVAEPSVWPRVYRRSHEPPCKYRCELNSPRYVEYRMKQAKHKSGKAQQQVWPDDVEEAFHDGMLSFCFSSHNYPLLIYFKLCGT